MINMIKVEKIDVNGFEAAIRGMRNPMNSWDRSDSCYETYGISYIVGKNDLRLMHKLFLGGPEHRKFMRMIHVSMDITAPLYWWKEFDTYKVGTVANSCSTMHKVHSKEFILDDFSYDHLTEESQCALLGIIKELNLARENFIETGDKKHWWQMIQLLPSSYNQKRTVDINYENAVTIIKQRAGHKLDEWHVLVNALENVPYMYEIRNGEDDVI